MDGIIYKINLTNEEVDRYLRQEEEIMVEVYDEDNRLVDNIKKTRKIPGKRKRKYCEKCKQNIARKKSKKEDKVEKFIKEINISDVDNDEITVLNGQSNKGSNIENLVERYNNLGSMNTTNIQGWYYFGQDFERKILEIRNQGQKRKTDQTARKEMYDQMMDTIINKEYVEDMDKKRDTVKEKVKGAVKVYKLFIEIGKDKIKRIKETYVTTIIKFTEEEKGKIIKRFRS
ncbi:hypothetical protein RhiirA4_517735 [Rhizophagus irregularis]|uniref:Uncharacterized protein n=1 Tax=Rhizophagus irregularis TaxID=588596 RepID=A0A2I1HMT0_9GLOM|nr:hypothetical protein RhiirA4_517735 [Rhizophagus irregularis]